MQAIKEQLLQSLVKALQSFYSKTDYHYPNLSLESAVYNQKSLKMQLMPERLLYHLLGVNSNRSGSYEVELAYDPTPMGIDYHKSALEFE